jgi:hypothetical protein
MRIEENEQLKLLCLELVSRLKSLSLAHSAVWERV